MIVDSIYLGMFVKNSMHANPTVYVVKRIDTEEEMAFIVPIDGGQGQWNSIGTLWATTFGGK